MTIGFITGGQAHNVIPESVKFGGTFRSLSSKGVLETKERIKQVKLVCDLIIQTVYVVLK